VKDPRYPDVHVRLLGEDGSAGAIMGRVTSALKRQGRVSEAECNEFRMQCISGTYDELLQTVMKWVTVDDFEDDGADGAAMLRVAELEAENAELRRRLEQAGG
jgi:hypothetical protein